MPESSVKSKLRRIRDKRHVETTTTPPFVRRIIAAHGRRIAAGDVEALRGLLQRRRSR
jgi:hypothetical protein